MALNLLWAAVAVHIAVPAGRPACWKQIFRALQATMVRRSSYMGLVAVLVLVTMRHRAIFSQ